MKKQLLQSLRNKSAIELQNELRGQQEKLDALRFDLSFGKMKNVREIRAVRKNIAQVMTVITEKNKETQNT